MDRVLSRTRLPLGLTLALLAQDRLAQRASHIPLNVLIYILGAALAGWAYWSGDFSMPIRPRGDARPGKLTLRPLFVGLAALLSVMAFLYSTGNRFQLLTPLFWGGAIAAILAALWEGEIQIRPLLAAIESRLDPAKWRGWLSPWNLLVLGVFGVAAYFRFYHLVQIPPEMWSDQAEKLLDVRDVLHGIYSIFFLRNTGREPLQFYIAAGTARLLGTGISYTTLKIGTTLAGYITLIYLYLFAKEYANRRVALAGVLLAGMAFWPNIISRVGLRFPFYPLFVAPVLYHLFKGLRLRQRNHVLISGVYAGVGLYGYSPARVIPLAMTAAVILFILHQRDRRDGVEYLSWLVGAGLIAFVIFVPLLKSATEMPDLFMYRTLTRLSDLERPIAGSPFSIFVTNLGRAMRMFAWDSGQVYVVTVTGRPLLDFVSGALFHVGIILLLLRYARDRDWRDLFMLLSLFILTLPSTLSIAFPNENPAPNRASGAMVPIFTIAGMSAVAGLDWARRNWPGRRALYPMGAALAMGGMMCGIINYQLTMVTYPSRMELYIWNTSEAAQVVKEFVRGEGSYENVHVVSFPHWMDTRLVAIQSGQPGLDYEVLPQNLSSLLMGGRPQLILLNIGDRASLSRLMELFPGGTYYRYDSKVRGKDFLVYYVPIRDKDASEAGS
jgi:hypothetical protein